MLKRRFHLSGIFAVLLALMAQLGLGASVPAISIAPVAIAGVLCHSGDDTGAPPPQQPGHPKPGHPSDCVICPLCVAMHASTAALVAEGATARPPAAGVVVRTELPPPSTAPPAPHRPPSQPRAPPTIS